MSSSISSGFNRPLEEWSHDDLVTWMTWRVVQGITAGEKLESVVFSFPHVVIQWNDAAKKARKDKK